MKAIMCDEPFTLTVIEQALPPRGRGEVMIRMKRIGLCGTDFHIFAGRQPYLSYPRIIGHELAGEVFEADTESGFCVGQAVTVNPYLACGECVACRNGKPNCCTSIEVLGVHRDGGMREFISVPEKAVIAVGDLTLDQAAMVEFLAVGCHAVRRADVAQGKKVLVVGAGPIGIAAALFARLRGAAVTIIDTSDERIVFARDPLNFAVDSVDANVSDRLRERTSGDFFDYVFDATGNVNAMRDGLAYLAHGGTYVLISVVKEDISFPDPEFHKRETTLLGSRNATSDDFIEVIARIRDGSIPTDKLLTHRIDALATPTGLPELMAHPGEVLKALVCF